MSQKNLIVLFILILISAVIPIFADSSNQDNAFYHPGTDPGAASSDSCISCHIDNNENQPFHFQAKCLECHQHIDQLQSKRYFHRKTYVDEFPENRCQGCHLLHQSSNPQLLYESEPQFCYSCHPETRDHKSHPIISFRDRSGLEYSIAGPDGVIINCASHCHELHGADFRFLCASEPGRQLCISCHEEFRQ